MDRGVFVTGNCHTAGVGAVLRTVLREARPELTVSCEPMPKFGSEDEELAFLHKISQTADVFISTADMKITRNSNFEKLGLRLVTYPPILFTAFHPDFTHLYRRLNREPINPGYNSSIIAWCYLNHIDPKDAIRLFNENVFKALGYFDRWNRSAKALSERFVKNGMNFDRFFLRVKRAGVFMHTMNHPGTVATQALTKEIGAKLGISPALFDQPMYIPDFLAGMDWPVYPEIGDHLSVAGRYLWRVGQKMMTLGEYIEFSFGNYRRVGFNKDDCALTGQDAFPETLDKVLGSYLGVSN